MNEHQLLQKFFDIILPLTVKNKINWIRCLDGGYQMEYIDSFKGTTSAYIAKRYRRYYITFKAGEAVNVIISKDPICKDIYKIAKENGDATLEHLNEFVKAISVATVSKTTYLIYIVLAIEFVVLSILMFLILFAWK